MDMPLSTLDVVTAVTAAFSLGCTKMGLDLDPVSFRVLKRSLTSGHGLGGAVTVLVCDGVFKRCWIKFHGDNVVMIPLKVL
ncbi:hypothetical protein Bca101_013727 [Brassica carinata]